MAQLGWRQAELATGAWMRAAGFEQVVVTSESGDGGIDVAADGAIAQVKARNVRIRDVQEFVGVAQATQQLPLYFTTGVYDEDAQEWARGHPTLELFQIRTDGEVIAANGSAASRLSRLSDEASAVEVLAEHLREEGVLDDRSLTLPLETPHELIVGRLDGHPMGVSEIREAIGRSGGRDVIAFSSGGFTLPARTEYADLVTLTTYNIASGTLDVGLSGRPDFGQWSENDAYQAADAAATYVSTNLPATVEPVDLAHEEYEVVVARQATPYGAPSKTILAGHSAAPTDWRVVRFVAVAAVVATFVAIRLWPSTEDTSPDAPDAPAFVDRDCGDFTTQAEAQAFFNSAGPNDPHRMDRDGDGRVCELLP